MPRRYKRCVCILRRWLSVCLVEAHALITLQDRIAGTGGMIVQAHARRHARDFPAAIFAWVHDAALASECLHKEGLDVVRLQPLGGRAFHFEAQFLDF